MANIAPTDLFAYVNANDNQAYVYGNELIDRGSWDFSAFYNPFDAITYSNSLYVALQINSGSAPTSIKDVNWSSLVRITPQSGTTSTSGSDAYARGLAIEALYTAWAGTLIGNQAFSIAVNGTQTANYALQVAIAGTNLGAAAYTIAVAGTNAAAAASAAASAAQTTANTALSTANTALNTAWAGTAAAAAIQLTDAGSAADGAGMATARDGSNLPVKRIASGRNVQVTATGSNVTLAVTQVDTRTVEWIGPSVGAVAPAAASTGTYLVDLSGQAYRTLSFAGSLHFAVTNIAPGYGVSTLLHAAGTTRGITYQNGITFIGQAPSTLDANRVAVVSFTAFGSNASDVIGAYSAQQ